MRPIATDGVAWSVCMCVCLYITGMIPAKTAKPIEMPFGMWARVGPHNYVLDGIQIPPQGEGTILGRGSGRHLVNYRDHGL